MDSNISKDDFIYFMKLIKEKHDFFDELDTVLYKYRYGTLDIPNDIPVEILNVALGLSPSHNNDTEIGTPLDYYIYELEFGTKYEPGCFKVDNKDVDISTPEKLYDYISQITKEDSDSTESNSKINN